MCRKNRQFQYTKKAIEKRFGPDLKKESYETNIQILESLLVKNVAAEMIGGSF